MVPLFSDDSPRLQGGGFWNDAGVSSHTVRSVHAQKRAMLKTTSVSHGTTLQHGRVFTHGPSPWNPSKRDSVENVQKNYTSILLHGWKSGNEQPACGRRTFHPLGSKPGAFRREYGKRAFL
jgi:hypothetical protein